MPDPQSSSGRGSTFKTIMALPLHMVLLPFTRHITLPASHALQRYGTSSKWRGSVQCWLAWGAQVRGPAAVAAVWGHPLPLPPPAPLHRRRPRHWGQPRGSTIGARARQTQTAVRRQRWRGCTVRRRDFVCRKGKPSGGSSTVGRAEGQLEE